jgi:hypothetical protein
MNKLLFPKQASDLPDDTEMIEPMLSEANERKHRWTKLHSHYALMGGFSMDYSALGPNAFPGHLTRLTLTSAAILKLAENEPVIIPDIDADHILDKSKANIFAKIIVCVQASWFIV